MHLPKGCYQICEQIEKRLPNLSVSQCQGLALWVYGAIMAASASQSAVARMVSIAGKYNTMRQYLREWLYDGKDRACPTNTQLDVAACFAPLLRWVLSLWESDQLALALDPTLKNDKLVAIVVSVLYRGHAIPVAWHIMKANEKGGWMRPSARLFRLLAPAISSDMKVVVMCDRGLNSPILWNQIRELGWIPLFRQVKEATFCPDGGTRNKAARMVNAPGQAWVGSGTAFVAKKKQRRGDDDSGVGPRATGTVDTDDRPSA